MNNSKKRNKTLINNAAIREQEAHVDLIDALERCRTGTTENVKIRRIQKITAAIVAKEAGRSRSILYSNHQDILQKIEVINRRRGSSQRTKRLEKEKKDQTFRELVNQLNRDKSALAQENYRLQSENAELKEKLKRRI